MTTSTTASLHAIADASPLHTDVFSEKLVRLHRGGQVRILDLFSGCGGLSLGFERAGCEILGAIELDRDAIKTHARNFHSGSDFFEGHAKPRDITVTEPKELFMDLGLEGHAGAQVDIVVGGPPCQAFTRVGRAKLREIKSDSNAFLNDPRSQLYKRYLEYVRQLKPLAILMENVPDVLNYGGVNIAELVCKDLAKHGYNCKYTLLNSVFYGVPQMRERMFLIAIHNSVDGQIAFPEPTHFAKLPKGYHGSRNVALKHINVDDNPYFCRPPAVNSRLPNAITVKSALSDLPILKDHIKGKSTRGIPELSEKLEYSNNRVTVYQALMRQNQLDKASRVSANAIRFLPRDFAIFKSMKHGDQYPEALKLAKSLFLGKIKRAEKKLGKAISQHSSLYKKLLKETVPPYDDSKFPNKWRKMEPNKPARTLMAHLGKDSYSHIHYDSTQSRTISVREAARLQSFPDNFEFDGSMNAAFRQIGNAVPPIMAEKVAKQIRKILYAAKV